MHFSEDAAERRLSLSKCVNRIREIVNGQADELVKAILPEVYKGISRMMDEGELSTVVRVDWESNHLNATAHNNSGAA
jgi:hypothetical protein